MPVSPSASPNHGTPAATAAESEPSVPPLPSAVHTLTAEAVAEALGTGPAGLSREEAGLRLSQYGPNEVQEERAAPWWALLLHQFRDPLIYILLIGALITLLLRDYTDTGVILGVVVLNAIIGFIQEHRAQRAMQALAQLSAPRAEVVRGGDVRDVPTRDLVPGDLVVLGSGARVPADLRMVRVRDLEVDESALTGESLPVRKTTDPLETQELVPGDQTNLAFAGTIVTRGRGRGIVVRTGARTEVGRIATSMREIGGTVTPLQRRVEGLGKWIGLVIVALSGLTVGIGLLQGMPMGDILVAAVAMAVATIPEGLPIVLTVTLAIGVRRMASRNAIVRSLPAVETLGSTTVIGSDKTGTLTRNEMTVRAVWAGGRLYEVTGSGYAPDGGIELNGRAVSLESDAALRETLLAGVLANEADPAALGEGSPPGDPTEVALHVAARKAGLDPERVRAESPELDILPFEPERRFMATLHRTDGTGMLYLKGAPEAILPRCAEQADAAGGVAPLDPEAARAAASELAARGLRVLAMAYRADDGERIAGDELESGFTFAGLQAMEDPVRTEAIDAVRAVRESGIRVLMLTGDHVATASAIGAQLGLGSGADEEAIEGARIATLSDEELDALVRRHSIYARVAPEHKLRIVQRLKAQGEVVAVTGDGVNDAPALRAAHLGIAMGRGGTDVAREASDMVLADDNFATITAAVEEGRIVFANIRKVTFFLLSTGVAMPITILVALIAGWPLPFIAAQILWINLVTNGLQDVALAFEPGEPRLLRRPPRPATEGIVTLRLLERLAGVGLLVAAGTLGMFWWTWQATGDVALAQSVAMTQMVVFQFFHVFNSRSLDRSIFTIPLLSNRFLFASIIAAAIAQLTVLYVPLMQAIFRTVPLGLEHWGMILLVGTSVIVGGELDKWRNARRGTPLG
jgi:magnesium-transporting ATPase (P-type)